MHLNPNHPLNEPVIMDVTTLATLNLVHECMKEHIAEAHDSLGVQQVAATQYAIAVNDVRRAVTKLLNLQERTMDLAWVNRPHKEVEDLKDQLGLKS